MMRIAVVFSFVAGFILTVIFGGIASGGAKHASLKPPDDTAAYLKQGLETSSALATPAVTSEIDNAASADAAKSLKDAPAEEATEDPLSEAETASNNEAGGAVDTDSSAVDTASFGGAERVAPSESGPGPSGPKSAPSSDETGRKALAGVNLSAMKLSDGKYRQRTEDGREIQFTVDTEVQKYAEGLFAQYEVPAAAAVLINSHTGRIIALAQERSVADAAPSNAVALDASPPAASVFKIVTTAALLDNGISLADETCYAGGSGGLNIHHLEEQLPKNHACVSVSTALGRSVNAVFAKLSDKFLNRRILAAYAERFGFNRPLEFDVPIQSSSAEIPSERLERARTAAGFWHTHLSPVHAAAIAQSLAQGGAMLRPYVVDRVVDASGNIMYESKTKYLGHTVAKETADSLKSALVYTTSHGTARKAFHDASGRPYLPGIDVAGKTGTLTGDKPYRAYTWFVGLAPANNPEVAVSVLVVNTPKWRIKASQAAAMILKKYFETRKRR